ncbi:MAG: S53 family peptidase [Actinomycetota bacterium]|nr:S53 family peptidase [Actinomycetota bacterium]
MRDDARSRTARRTRRLRRTVALSVLAATSVAAVPRPADAQQAPAPLPDSVGVAQPDVVGGVRHPLRLRVLGRTPDGSPLLATSETSGYTPAEVRAYLGLTGTGAGQTIAIVTAYDAPNVAKDLAVFDDAFDLPAPPSFRKVNQSGGTKYPKVDAGWALEAALDVQWAHAVAPAASILLVEASSSSLTNLLTAVSYATKQPGVTVVSGSFGTPQFAKQTGHDSKCRLTTGVCVFASGDEGNPGTYPAANPYALAVGGTSLLLGAAGEVDTEVAWSDSGGGVSPYAAKPAYQDGVTTATRRTLPDVSYSGDPATGFAVYSSTPVDGQSGWFQMGGTSAGAPQWAGVVAVANQLRKGAGKGPLVATTSTGASPLHTALYRSGALGDITSGSNGDCGAVCTAGPGFDAVTGLGSPRRGLDVVLRDAS